ncbi:MAG: VWA domain-containing protein [Blastocatellia bacterium]|nr:VWA domain-containing protein [Blastocatellia bacterium]
MRSVFESKLVFVLTLTLLFAVITVSNGFFRAEAETYEILDQSFEFKTGGTVKIENGSGEIRVEVWAEELVHVTAKKVEPPGHAIALSDVSFLSTKNQINIRSKSTESNIRIDMVVYIPRNTNLRIVTTSGTVQVKGLIASAMVETQSGNIRLESPSSQDADVVVTTKNGTIKSALPIDAYGNPTNKSLQGKLGSGGNPMILRSAEGSITLAVLEKELDQDVATIPSAPPAYSSSDSSSSYRYNQDSLFGGGRDYDYGRNRDIVLGPNQSTLPPQTSQRRKQRQDDEPYTYGGSYGGNSPSSIPSGGNKRDNTDIFGSQKDDDESGSAVDVGNLGARADRQKGSKNDTGSIGVRIIPPPGASRRDDSDDTIYHNPASKPQSPRNIDPRPQNSGQYSDPSNSNRGGSLSRRSQQSDYSQPDDDYSAPNAPRDANRTVSSNPPNLRRNGDSSSDQRVGSLQKTASDDDDGTIKIDTKLVTMNVNVMDRSGRAVSNLKTENFQVFEDGVQQSISHFEPVNSPFNLVLLIDLSGSIIDKIDILRRAAIRFIEVTRPEDKVAIVTFTRSVQVVSDFTNDRQLLRQRLQYMHMPKGGTAFYESLWFTVAKLMQPVEGERNAVVLLSDGVDNSISVNYPIPSRVTFEQVLRKVQESSSIIFPIYLDTEFENVEQQIESPESYSIARRQLSVLAESSGGVFIRAAKVENLEGIYEKVAADLRTLYSVGYYPTNPNRDGSWRKIKVKVDKADVAVRTRRGYYAK